MRKNLANLIENVYPCPVCNRYPKIHQTTDKFATVSCKRLFGKPHIEIEVSVESESNLITTCRDRWNWSVRYAKISALLSSR